jgi:phage-related baseplate assembly protein
MKSELFASLPDIVFAERDAAVIEREIISGYEQAFEAQYGESRTLYPGDPVRLFLETVAFVIVHQRYLIDRAAKQNLLAYAEGKYLDHLGALLGVTRLPERPAVTTLRFSISAPQEQVVLIPAGTRATPGGGEIIFATVRDAEIPPGEISAEAEAECTAVGSAGNGYLPGQISGAVDVLPWQSSVANTTESSGGSDAEDDENYRERIQMAPESFTTAGPRGAYEYHARTAHQDIVDVAVVGPPDIPPGEVEIYPLMRGGELPTQDILDLVASTCGADDVRPLTDLVRVLAPVPVEYDVDVAYWIGRDRVTQARAIQAAVEEAVDGWVLWQRSKIGRDILPSQLVRLMMAAGARRVEVRSPVYREIGGNGLAVARVPVRVVYGGLEDA